MGNDTNRFKKYRKLQYLHAVIKMRGEASSIGLSKTGMIRRDRVRRFRCNHSTLLDEMDE